MKVRRAFHFVILLLFASVCGADITLVYDANHPEASAGLTLVETSSEPVHRVSKDGHTELAPPENKNYFERKGLAFRIDGAWPADAKEARVLIEHMDRSIGLIEVDYDADRPRKDDVYGDRPAYTAASAVAGYTSVGTNTARTAVFSIQKPSLNHRQASGADIQIYGVRSLTKVTVTTADVKDVIDAARAGLPVAVEPRVRLKRPMQLVTTVGADARKHSDLSEVLPVMREMCPVAAALGFNGVESYVKWNFIEKEKGVYDWSFYDGVVEETQKHGLKWFPLLIVGSAYSLPTWFHDSEENVGFVCLEHGKRNNIQTIFADIQSPYVRTFLKAFGAHYEPMNALLGVRLGPSGNFGESQYPAGGNWGYAGQTEHIHIGWWAGDAYAAPHFQSYLKKRYATIDELNRAWKTSFASFDEVKPFIAQFAEARRQRVDMTNWYMDAMTDWCERWALWAREGMPKTDIYQSSGGWGFVESGTDFTDQTKSMTKVKGGIRATNETDSYAQNFYVTRMMSSAARFYGVPFGSEPAGFGSARGMVARLYNILVNNGQHLFYYSPTLLNNDQAVDKWLELAPLLDQRAEPFIEVAALYPDTLSKLDDGVFRNLYSFSFNRRVAVLRPKLDFDFCSERMVIEGALPRYKVLLFMWNSVIEAETLNAIDAWVQNGGTVLAGYWDRQDFSTVEEDYTIHNKWLNGDTGKGRVVFIRDDREPPERLANDLVKLLLETPELSPLTQRMLRVEKPDEVYVSVLQNGAFALLNYNDDPVTVKVPDVGDVSIAPYSIAMTKPTP